MRIAFDARPLSTRMTGIGRYLTGLLGGFRALDEVEGIWLWSPRRIETGREIAEDPRVRCLTQDGWKGNLWLQLVLPRLLERHRPDLFHASLFLPPFAARVPCIVNVYDLTVYRHPESMEDRNRWFLRLLLPWAVRRAERVVTLSESMRREIESRWPHVAGKVAVVPGAPTLFSGSPVARSAAGGADRILARLGVRRPYLLCVGTLEPRKNIARLLAAFDLLRKTGGGDHQLVLVGQAGWGMRGILGAMEACQAREAVRWIGYVEDEVLAVLYRNAEVFVYPSLYEGFGLPPLEAMAAGTCVVSSGGGSLAECLGDAAVGFDPLDPHSIASALGRVLRDADLRREYARKGKERAAGYGWDRSARMMLEVYRDHTGG